MSDEPTLREYVEREIESLKELVIQRFDQRDTALALQAAEYERRLIALNHAHEKAMEIFWCERCETEVEIETTPAKSLAEMRHDCGGHLILPDDGSPKASDYLDPMVN